MARSLFRARVAVSDHLHHSSEYSHGERSEGGAQAGGVSVIVRSLFEVPIVTLTAALLVYLDPSHIAFGAHLSFHKLPVLPSCEEELQSVDDRGEKAHQSEPLLAA